MNTDITKCEGTDCPIKASCVRYTTPPDEYRQAYFATPPWRKDENGEWKCEMYWGPAQESIMKQLNDIVNGES
jgi:hypothetical protein